MKHLTWALEHVIPGDHFLMTAENEGNDNSGTAVPLFPSLFLNSPATYVKDLETWESGDGNKGVGTG